MAATFLRPSQLRTKLQQSCKGKSTAQVSREIGCAYQNLCEALRGKRQIPRAAARSLGYTRVTAYIKTEFAYSPLDNKQKES